MTRKLKKGGYTAILSVIVIAVVIVINMIVNRLPQNLRQWDISSNQIYTVGDTTKELVNALDKDVKIYIVADPTRVDERITGFVNRYAALSSHIKVETVDSVLHPEQVKSLEAEDNSVLVVCEAADKKETISLAEFIKYDEASYYYYGQSKETEFDGEGKLTSAISHVTNDVQKTVYVTEGHGENALGETVTDMLGKSGLTSINVNLLTEGSIPEDCQLLLINGPQTDLADDEKTMITDYLNNGGNAVIIAGYSDKARENLNSILNEYGLNLEIGLAADTKSAYQNNPFYIFPTIKSGNEITNGIDAKGAALVIQSGAMTETTEVPEGVTVTPFMETTDGGLLVTENEQIEGTYLLGAASEKTLDSGTSRLTVFTTPTLIEESLNQTFSNLTNLDIFMNAVTANYDDVVNVSIPSKSLEVTYNTVTHGGMWGLLFILVIPAVTLGAGLTIWLKRRRL